MAHRLTADQLDFIVMHELGHVALDHPVRLKAESGQGRAVTTLRHEFEFAADAFALGLMRSKLVNRVRGAADPANEVSAGDVRIDRVTTALHDYQSGLGASYLLLAYMDFIQRAGELLRKRCDGRIPMRAQMDTHPRASARLERLELANLGEPLYTSPLERYSREFLQSVLDYASSLDDESFLNSVVVPTL
jgi:Zn-dependent protease with chaperone function